MIRRLLIPGVAAVVLTGALTGTALAAPSATDGLAVTVDTATAAAPDAAALPSVGIVKGANGPHFTKAYISGKRSGRVHTACRRTNASFTVANRSARSQTLTVQGRDFATIPAGGAAFVCGFGSSSFSATFHLARNAKTSLHATFR